MDIYTGKKNGQVDKGLATRVVKELTVGLVSKNHHVFFDNFFTSEKLLTWRQQVCVGQHEKIGWVFQNNC